MPTYFLLYINFCLQWKCLLNRNTDLLMEICILNNKTTLEIFLVSLLQFSLGENFLEETTLWMTKGVMLFTFYKNKALHKRTSRRNLIQVGWRNSRLFCGHLTTFTDAATTYELLQLNLSSIHAYGQSLQTYVAEEVSILEETVHGQRSAVVKNWNGEKYLLLDFVLVVGSYPAAWTALWFVWQILIKWLNQWIFEPYS